MATDAEIRAGGLYAIPQQKYLQNPFQIPINTPVVEEEETESFGIPNTNAFTNSGDNNFNPSFSNNPYTAQPSGSFVTNRTSYGGYLPGTKPEPSKFQPVVDLIGKGIGMAIPGGNFLMGMAKQNSRENKLNAYDNAFIDMQLANQEQSVHGGGNLTNQDRYGYNKESMFGNYADLVSKNAAKANAKNPEDLTDFDRYYQEKEKEEEDIKDQIDFNNFAKQRGLANKIREQIKNKTIDVGFNIHNDDGDKPPPPPPNNNNDGGGGFDRAPGPDPTGSKERGFNMHGDGKMADGGRAGYFFGGRVNYKAGGTGNKDAEALGFNYISDNKYLQDDFTGSTPLDFSNISSSGIMSKAPIPQPLKYIPDGGGGPVDPGPPGSYDSQFDPVTENKEFNEDIGVGTIAEEDDEEKGELSVVDGIRAAGAYALGGPLHAISSINKAIERAKQKEIDEINAAIDAQYGYGTGPATQSDIDSYGIDPDTGNPGNYDQDYDMKDGGRAGYFFGGRVRFKNGGLASIL